MSLSLDGFEKFAAACILDTGEPMRLEPFQSDLVRDFCDPALREIWCVLPESSGKSTLLAIFALYVLMVKPGATVTVGSVTQAQAGSAIHRQASDAISRSPGLGNHLRAVDGRLRIYGPQRSRLDVKPSTPNTAQGAISDITIMDEVGEQTSLNLAQLYRGKLTKRAGAKLLIISSAGEPGGQFELALEAIRQGAEQVQRDGKHTRFATGTTVLHEYRLQPGDEVRDWATLKQANPLSSTTEESLREKYESPLTSEAHFRRYTAGIPERDESHVVSREVWDGARFDFDALDGERLHEVILGVDFAQSYDSFAAVSMVQHNSGLLLLGPALVIEPRRPGEPIPLETMQEGIRSVVAEGVGECWLNPAAGSSPLEAWIDANIAPCTVYGMSQPEATELAELFLAALHSGRLKHSGDQALTTHTLNARARYNWTGDSFAFTRPVESRTAKNQITRRIDALSAACLCVKGASTIPLPFSAEEIKRLGGITP